MKFRETGDWEECVRPGQDVFSPLRTTVERRCSCGRGMSRKCAVSATRTAGSARRLFELKKDDENCCVWQLKLFHM